MRVTSHLLRIDPSEYAQISTHSLTHSLTYARTLAFSDVFETIVASPSTPILRSPHIHSVASSPVHCSRELLVITQHIVTRYNCTLFE